jgi:hypothetical protein
MDLICSYGTPFNLSPAYHGLRALKPRGEPAGASSII